MLTQRDRQILRFVEDFGGITIWQSARMFFRESKRSYDLSRKRLKILHDMGLLKSITNKLTDEKIYCVDKKISPHTSYLLDVYSTLIYNGAKILSFQKEPKWLDGQFRSDGFFLIEYNGVKRIICVEIDVTSATNIDKYEAIFENNEFQKKYGVFPLIVIIDENPSPTYSNNFDVVYLNYKLNDFTEKVLAL
jgi:replication initiation and membrane attachment protein DnaB